MKKPIFILRIGMESLITIDRIAIGELQTEESDVLGCPLPFGVLSIVLTDLSPSDLVERYNKAALDTNDHGPCLAWDPRSEDASFNLVKDYPHVQNLIKQWESMHEEELIPEKNTLRSVNR